MVGTFYISYAIVAPPRIPTLNILFGTFHHHDF
jgi:hypothetical protein